MFTYLLIHYIDYNILTLHMKGFLWNFFFPEYVYRFHEKVSGMINQVYTWVLDLMKSYAKHTHFIW